MSCTVPVYVFMLASVKTKKRCYYLCSFVLHIESLIREKPYKCHHFNGRSKQSVSVFFQGKYIRRTQFAKFECIKDTSWELLVELLYNFFCTQRKLKRFFTENIQAVKSSHFPLVSNGFLLKKGSK